MCKVLVILLLFLASFQSLGQNENSYRRQACLLKNKTIATTFNGHLNFDGLVHEYKIIEGFNTVFLYSKIWTTELEILFFEVKIDSIKEFHFENIALRDISLTYNQIVGSQISEFSDSSFFLISDGSINGRKVCDNWLIDFDLKTDKGITIKDKCIFSRCEKLAIELEKMEFIDE